MSIKLPVLKKQRTTDAEIGVEEIAFEEVSDEQPPLDDDDGQLSEPDGEHVCQTIAGLQLKLADRNEDSVMKPKVKMAARPKSKVKMAAKPNYDIQLRPTAKVRAKPIETQGKVFAVDKNRPAPKLVLKQAGGTQQKSMSSFSLRTAEKGAAPRNGVLFVPARPGTMASALKVKRDVPSPAGKYVKFTGGLSSQATACNVRVGGKNIALKLSPKIGLKLIPKAKSAPARAGTKQGMKTDLQPSRFAALRPGRFAATSKGVPFTPAVPGTHSKFALTKAQQQVGDSRLALATRNAASRQVGGSRLALHAPASVRPAAGASKRAFADITTWPLTLSTNHGHGSGNRSSFPLQVKRDQKAFSVGSFGRARNSG